MQSESQTVRLRVSPEVARLVAAGTPRELQLTAARGETTLTGQDLLTALLFLAHRGDPEIRRQCLATLHGLPGSALLPVVQNREAPAQLLDFIARRPLDPDILALLLDHPALSADILARVAAAAGPPALALIARSPLAAAPVVAAALASNPLAADVAELAAQAEPRSTAENPASGDIEGEDAAADDEDLEEPAEEDVNASKYQLALQMEVGEKIKTAMTGDKEWRTIFIKDPNKLVSSAVLKNPRVTEGEVLTIAKNKSSHDELIRLIVLNREWIKNYEIQKALILHPKTPLPKALRYMNILTLKDIKMIAKSRSISPVLVNNARRMLSAKEKKR